MCHTVWHVKVHAPVEFSIRIGICEDTLVESFYTSHASLIVSNCGVDFTNEGIPVLLILSSHLCVHSIDLLEPLHDLVFIVTESKGGLH